jgi:hypothetical protein
MGHSLILEDNPRDARGKQLSQRSPTQGHLAPISPDLRGSIGALNFSPLVV